MRATSCGAEVSGTAAGEGLLHPAVDDGQGAGSVQVVGQVPADAVQDRLGRRAGRLRHRLPPPGEPRLAGREVRLGPGPVAAVVVREQGEPQRHRVAARRGAVPRRRPGCPRDFDIFSPSSPTIPACT